mmetsp:Transcript_59394/g.105076  ORF Transcript_59394/g.105076 Transcript_59394/m.105076 type:complete len:138 (+) Transcript_59394:2-415(+)
MASLMTAPAYFPQYGSAEWTAQLQSYMQALPPFPHHHSDPSNGPLQHQLWLKHLEANIVQNQLHLHQMLLLMQQPLLPSSSYHGHPPIGAQHGFLERAQKNKSAWLSFQFIAIRLGRTENAGCGDSISGIRKRKARL